MSIPSDAAGRLASLIDKVVSEATRCLRSPGVDEAHDIRVAIRRLQQALRLFKHWLPPKATAKIRRTVRKVLKRAGDVRDLDIAFGLIGPEAPDVTDAMRQALTSRREIAAARLNVALTRLNSQSPEEWPTRLGLDAADRQARNVVLALAHRVLPELAADFIASGARLAAHPKSAETLHAFRISAKRFRYSLESFADLYGPGLAYRVRTVREIQTVLGDLNDIVATRALVKKLGAPPETLQRLRELQVAKLSEFQETWPRLFDATAADKWKRFLERAPARAPAARTGARKVARKRPRPVK